MTVFAQGRHVVVTLPEVGAVPGRIERAGEDTIDVALFVPTQKPVSALRGEASIEVTTPRGVYEVVGSLTPPREGAEIVSVLLSGESRVVQRREFVRVEAVVHAAVARDEEGAPEREVTVIDISGGGFRLAGAEWVDIGERVRFNLDLGDSYPPVEGLARCVRIAEKGTRGCRIEKIDRDAREALVRFTFDRQRQELRKGRS